MRRFRIPGMKADKPQDDLEGVTNVDQEINRDVNWRTNRILEFAQEGFFSAAGNQWCLLQGCTRKFNSIAMRLESLTYTRYLAGHSHLVKIKRVKSQQLRGSKALFKLKTVASWRLT